MNRRDEAETPGKMKFELRVAAIAERRRIAAALPALLAESENTGKTLQELLGFPVNLSEDIPQLDSGTPRTAQSSP